MNIILDLLNDVTKSYGVRMQRYREDFINLENYDGGLRAKLFLDYRADHLAESLKAIMTGTIYTTQDTYKCYYIFFRIPEDEYCIIGPWLEEKIDDTDLDILMNRDNIPYHLKSDLVQYFNWAAQIASPHSWRGAIFAFFECLYGKPPMGSLAYVELDENSQGEYSPEPEAVLSMQKIEEHYHIENAMADAISRGDAKDAFQCFTKHREYRENKWVKNELKYWKDYNIVLNTIARKAAERGYVHPLHIDSISAGFIRRIGEASTAAEVNRLSENILHRYCLVVREFSLAGYSPVVRNVINFVDFNLRESLSLKTLAKQFNVNASYLSALFKKEKGITLTDYINTKRLHHAASLLNNSGLYIQDIAEQCGFLDFNYFTRLFKRHYGQSPRDFKVHFKG